MSPPHLDLNLLDIARGAIVAPAGCGKTELIVRTLARHDGRRPVLVLTHTNAGVYALRARLRRAGVEARHYRVATIDGWALRLSTSFPRCSGLPNEVAQLRNPRRDYPAIRQAACELLAGGHIADALRATYARLVVDEYQDCSDVQHAIVTYVASLIPAVVLGDPMQAIFGFGDDHLADWTEVCDEFPVHATLDTPWRWIRVGESKLGEWLREVREKLEQGDRVDLTTAPTSVKWIELDGTGQDHRRQLQAARTRAPVHDGTVLILADSTKPAVQQRVARSVPGAATVEAVDLRDFVRFAESIDFASPNALQRVLRFASAVMTDVDPDGVLARLRTLQGGSARRQPSPAEVSAIRFQQTPNPRTLAELLEALNRRSGTRVFRPIVLRACFQALQRCGTSALLFAEAARQVREEYRAGGRVIASRAVGSTLLLKGLEADVAVVLDASTMDARHLYVAMTRGSRRLVVCARTRWLLPD